MDNPKPKATPRLAGITDGLDMSILEIHENHVNKCVGTVAMITRNQIAADTAISWMMTDTSFLNEGEYMKRFIIVGNVLTFQRNECINNLEGDWILFIDSDMVWQPEAIKVLVETRDKFDLDIVGGLCFQRGDPYQPTLYKKAATGGGYTYLEKWPENAAYEVDATGMAFCLVHKRVFDRVLQSQAKQGFGEFEDHEDPETGEMIKGRKGQIPAPFFRWEGRYGEDFLFCQEAKAVGCRIFVDTSVKVGHVGEQVITEETFLREIAFRHPLAQTFRSGVLEEIGEQALTREEAMERLGWTD